MSRPLTPPAPRALWLACCPGARAAVAGLARRFAAPPAPDDALAALGAELHALRLACLAALCDDAHKTPLWLWLSLAERRRFGGGPPYHAGHGSTANPRWPFADCFG